MGHDGPSHFGICRRELGRSLRSSCGDRDWVRVELTAIPAPA